MHSKFTNMMHRKLTVDWNKDRGELDLRNHALGGGYYGRGYMTAS